MSFLALNKVRDNPPSLWFRPLFFRYNGGSLTLKARRMRSFIIVVVAAGTLEDDGVPLRVDGC